MSGGQQSGGTRDSVARQKYWAVGRLTLAYGDEDIHGIVHIPGNTLFIA